MGEDIMQDWMINEAKSNIGLNLIDMGNHEDAIDHYTREIESDPTNNDLYILARTGLS